MILVCVFSICVSVYIARIQVLTTCHNSKLYRHVEGVHMCAEATTTESLQGGATSAQPEEEGTTYRLAYTTFVPVREHQAGDHSEDH